MASVGRRFSAGQRLFSGRVAGSTSDVQKELSQQMEQISEQHQKQLTTLRDEIRAKETQTEGLKEYVDRRAR